MKRVAITGLSGVIGGVLIKELSAFEVIDLYHTKKYKGSSKISKYIHLNLEKTSEIKKALKSAKPEIIIHLAAITHIDRCEEDKKFGKKGIVWKVNVQATSEIAKFASQHNIPLIFLSTECVFDGKKKSFSESAKKNPLNWYGSTKSEAEDLVLSSGAHGAIVRSVVAYCKNDSGKTIYGKILKELETKKNIKAVSDRLFTPTCVDDIVKAVKIIMDKNLAGIFHVVPTKIISPYQLAVLIAKANDFSANSVQKIRLNSYYDPKRAALRLRNASLDGRKTNRILKFTPRNPRDVI